MRIAIIGTGNVGTALGKGWARAGHSMVYGSRHPASVDCGVGTADTIAGAAGQGEVIVLAVPFGAAVEAVVAGGRLDGKVVVDATNPMGATLGGGHASGAALIAATATGAHVVKAFNTMGWETMAEPVVDGRAALGLVAGDDPAAKQTVLALARDLGFEAVDAGGIEAAELLEDLARLWVHLAFRAGQGRGMAFALVRR